MTTNTDEGYVPEVAELVEFARDQRANPALAWPVDWNVPDNMSGLDLRGLRIGALRKVNIEGALLQGACIGRMHTVKGCGADLIGATIKGIIASDLCGADLTGATLHGELDATLIGAVGIRQYGPVGRRGRIITGIAPLDPAAEPMIRAGFHWDTMSAALRRINAEYEGHPLRDEYLRAIYMVGGRPPVDPTASSLAASSLEISQNLLRAAEKALENATQALTEANLRLFEARARANALTERLDRARMNVGQIIQRAMQRGDLEEVATLHREMRQI